MNRLEKAAGGHGGSVGKGDQLVAHRNLLRPWVERGVLLSTRGPRKKEEMGRPLHRGSTEWQSRRRGARGEISEKTYVRDPRRRLEKTSGPPLVGTERGTERKKRLREDEKKGGARKGESYQRGLLQSCTWRPVTEEKSRRHKRKVKDREKVGMGLPEENWTFIFAVQCVARLFGDGGGRRGHPNRKSLIISNVVPSPKKTRLHPGLVGQKDSKRRDQIFL